MSAISDAMRDVFNNSINLYFLERDFNYQNYGKYPYRDRKNSMQIVADFNANAYSVNGLFVTESSYTEFYPSYIVGTIQQVIVGSTEVYQSVINEDGTTSDPALVLEYQQYQTVVVNELVEVEAVEVQTVRYVFPFDCVPDSMGRLRLSF
ncbi:hypothetical protein [Pseudanabaena yagii]|uniref:Uncharacterized protein n=1 Tax=Pseudanabaena yagii GIHE-NHR1 TaxID=2722753 RepID=A0ABX1LYW2_9CYAN|nr:hypothetical protein [Pseudanabaena yagii]NMF60165.1 hypothetical protein [Pseudanabaena yagii GIHE-NHR1]